MEKKYYQIITKTPEDWKIVHKLLMQDGTLEDNIPERSVECVNDIKHSKTRSTYLMTDDEAELLRQSDRILSVCYDSYYYPEYTPISEPSIKRFGRPVRNYRSLRKFNPSTNKFDYNLPITKFDGRNSDEFYRTGYQILRCTSENNPFSSNSAEVKYQDIDYSTDGTDVDCIVVDSGAFYGHPEFCSNEYDPQNYVRGNVLSRHGICGLLDLFLDAPYYLDPEWFDADPTNRLEKRWDGTTVPKEQVAKDWWAHSSNRSSGFPNFGEIGKDPDPNTFTSTITYSREDFCGLDRKTRPKFGSHGTPCASLLYGKNFGWAFNSNKWTIGKRNYDGSTSQGVGDEILYDIIKIFNQYKPNNPKFGTKDKTVVSASWNSQGPIVGDVYSYRGGPEIPIGSNRPAFLSGSASVRYFDPFISNDPTFLTAPAVIQSGKEMIRSGVIFVNSAGNQSRYLGTRNDEDWENYTVTNGLKRYTNRPGYPGQIGEFGDIRYDSFIIGGIDDEYTGRPSYSYASGTYSLNPETNSTFISEPNGKETLIRREGTYRSNDNSADFSNKGSGIDFYAPADGTLAASVSTETPSYTTYDLPDSPLYPNAYQPFSDITYNDRHFGGTSGACPVSAGLIACFLQNNRDISLTDLKLYLRNNIASQNSSEFFIGPRPGSDPNDPAWLVPYSTMGRSVKIIKEVTSRNGTINSSFTPTYGIASNFGANERFTISQSSSLTHKIEILGIKNFNETPATYELNVKTGYYRVGARSEVTFDQLKTIKLRVDPSNSKKLQLTDSDGTYGWNDMEITVFNGEFKQVTTEVYYVFSGGVLPGNQAYVGSGAAGPAYVPPAPGGGTITGGGDLIVTGDIVAGDDIIGLVSDERLKENIKPIENALDKLEKLDGFTYNFNEIGERLGFDPNKRHSGVSAQIVKDVLPEASAPAPADNDYLTVKYDKLIPLLIESIKDLKDDIDEIKKNDGK